MNVLLRALIVLAALVLFVFAIVAVNQEQISLRFLAWRTPSLSVFWWLFLALILGLILGFTAALGIIGQQSIRNRRLRRELAAANEARREIGEQPSA